MELHTENSGLQDLIRSLLNETFAVEQGFNMLSLTEIGQLIEEARDQFENPDSLSEPFLQKLESFERCKATYCLLLLELEMQNVSEIPQVSLGELLGSAPQIMPMLSIEDHDAMGEKTMIGMGIAKFETHAEKMEEDIPVMEPISPMLSHEVAPETEAKSEIAKGFISLTQQLRELRQAPGGSIDSSSVDRTIAQTLCWTLEAELFGRIKETLNRFWLVRTDAISQLIQPSASKGVELVPALKNALEEQALQYSDWLYEARFPVQGIVTSLRYFLSVPNAETFSPAPLDLAGLLLFFGHNETLGVSLHNHLGAQGLSTTQVMELAFRLTRVQRLKAKVLSPHTEWEDNYFHQLEEDIQACMHLVLKLWCGDTKDLRSVA